MATPTDYEVLAAMERYGGAFVRALAKAGYQADEDNLTRIKRAWPEYWARYAAMAKGQAGVAPGRHPC